MNKNLRPVSQCSLRSPLRAHLRQASAVRPVRHLTVAKDSAGTWPTGEAAPPIDVSGNGGSPPKSGNRGDNGDGGGACCQLSLFVSTESAGRPVRCLSSRPVSDVHQRLFFWSME